MEDVDRGPTESTTAAKKTRKRLKVLSPDNYGLWRVGFENGGELPKHLKQAKWTNLKDAEEVVNNYNRGL